MKKRYTLRVCSSINIVDVERFFDDQNELLATVAEYLRLIQDGWMIEIEKNDTERLDAGQTIDPK